MSWLCIYNIHIYIYCSSPVSVVFCIVSSFSKIILNQFFYEARFFCSAFFDFYFLLLDLFNNYFFYLMNTCNMFLNIQTIIMGCLIKTQSKNSTHTIFQEGSPWATLIFNSMFVVVVLYSVKLFLKWTFSKILLSFPFPFLY